MKLNTKLSQVALLVFLGLVIFFLPHYLNEHQTEVFLIGLSIPLIGIAGVCSFYIIFLFFFLFLTQDPKFHLVKYFWLVFGAAVLFLIEIALIKQ